MATAITLELTRGELAALDAVRTGVSALAERDVDRESAVIAALELALVRLTDDYDLPEGAAETVSGGLESLRTAWSRGNACLT